MTSIKDLAIKYYEEYVEEDSDTEDEDEIHDYQRELYRELYEQVDSDRMRAAVRNVFHLNEVPRQLPDGIYMSKYVYAVLCTEASEPMTERMMRVNTESHAHIVVKKKVEGITVYQGPKGTFVKTPQRLNVKFIKCVVEKTMRSKLLEMYESPYAVKNQGSDGLLQAVSLNTPECDEVPPHVKTPLNKFQRRMLDFVDGQSPLKRTLCLYKAVPGDGHFYVNPYTLNVLYKEDVPEASTTYRRGGLVAATPGCGKTLAAFAVHPRAILVTTEELYPMAEKQRREHLAENNEVTVMTRKDFMRAPPEMNDHERPIFFDEAHTLNTAIVLKIGKYPLIVPTYFITATPWSRPGYMRLFAPGDQNVSHLFLNGEQMLLYMYENRTIYARTEMVGGGTVTFTEQRCPVTAEERAVLNEVHALVSDVAGHSIRHSDLPQIAYRRIVTLFERMMSGATFDRQLTLDALRARFNRGDGDAASASATKMAKEPPSASMADDCSVCLCSFEEPQQTPCGHLFCAQCIGLVMQRDAKCPLCRGHVHELYLPYDARVMEEKRAQQQRAPKRPRRGKKETIPEENAMRFTGKMMAVRERWAARNRDDKVRYTSPTIVRTLTYCVILTRSQVRHLCQRGRVRRGGGAAVWRAVCGWPTPRGHGHARDGAVYAGRGRARDRAAHAVDGRI